MKNSNTQSNVIGSGICETLFFHQVALPNLRGVALLASLVEAFVNVVSITITIATIIIDAIIYIAVFIIPWSPSSPRPLHYQYHHQFNHEVSIDSPAPWSLPVTTHRKVVEWHGEDWATQVIFNYCCCCCFCCCCFVLLLLLLALRGLVDSGSWQFFFQFLSSFVQSCPMSRATS